MRQVSSRKIDFSNAVVFWMLAVMGLAVLGACAILPIYQQYLEVRTDRFVISQQVSQLHQKLDEVNLRIEALQNDPQYNEFVARNELNYRKPGQKSISILPEPVHPDQTIDKTPDIAAAGQIQPAADNWWRRMFLNRVNRVIMLLMGGTCLAVAILVCKPQGKSVG